MRVSFIMRCQCEKLLFVLYLVALIIMVQNNYMKFTFMPQALALIEDQDITQEIWWHSVRLLLAIPGYFIAQLFDISLDKGYSYYGIIIFLYIYIYISKIMTCSEMLLGKAKNLFFRIFTFGGLLVLAANMNGRLMFAYLGFAILIHTFLLKRSENFFTKLILGILLSMVSTGTMLVTVSYAVIAGAAYNHFLCDKTLKDLWLRYKWFAISVAGILFCYVFLMIEKILIFYQGELLHIFNHGVGGVLLKHPVWAIIFVALVLLPSLFLKRILKKDWFLFQCGSAFIISLFSLLVGYSAGTMGLLPLLFLLVHFWNCKQVVFVFLCNGRRGQERI